MADAAEGGADNEFTDIIKCRSGEWTSIGGGGIGGGGFAERNGPGPAGLKGVAVCL